MGTHRLAPGTVLGRYELLLPIAQGGMATVWAARQKGSRGFSKTVAVKTMLPNLSEDPTFEQMFLDEASIASRIHHPNVAEILDLGEQDEVLYLVMEWVDGESLSALSKQTKRTETEVPLRVALKIVAQACAGLHAAHELKDDNDQLVELVHRDVSPQNILVASTGHVKLVDFGVAKALGRSGATSVGQLKGKVPYMSPEQTRGQDVDRRTDVFAMGSVLYRITTGFHPFIEENDIRTMRSIASRPAIRPRVKNPNLPADLEQVILKALEKNPDKRYQTAAELEIDLDRVIATTGGPVAVEEIGGFARIILGERDQKRRAALRDAVRTADEQTSGPSFKASRSSSPSDRAPIYRNSIATVSDLMLTKSATPPSFTTGAVALSDEPADGSDDDDTRLLPPPSEAGEVTLAGALDAMIPLVSGADAAQKAPAPSDTIPAALGATPSNQAAGVEPRASGGHPSGFGPLSEPPLASSPTLAAVTDATTGSRPRPKRVVGVVVALGGALAVVLAVGWLVTKPNPEAPPTNAHGSIKAAPSLSSSATSLDADPSASAAEVSPDAAAGASASGVTTLAVGDLRDNPLTAMPGVSARPATGRPVVAAKPVSSAPPGPSGAPIVAATKPTGPAAPETPKPGPVATPTSKPWVPAVQDPGF